MAKPLEPDHLARLVEAAAAGDDSAFEKIVDQFSALAWSVCRSYQLSRTESEDAVQGVWLRVVQHLGSLREPSRVAGWIATTARRECLAVIRARGRISSIEPVEAVLRSVGTDPSEPILVSERRRVVRDALANLDDRCRELLALACQSPAISYEDIGLILSMPVGSIGPTRARCIEKLRRNRSLAALLEAQ